MAEAAANTPVARPRGIHPGVRLLAKLILVGIAVQFVLGGLGTFDTAHGGRYSDSYFSAHGTCALVITGIAAVMLIVALVTRSGARVAWETVALGLLTAPVQHQLAQAGTDHAPWVGSLHVLTGLLILVLDAHIAYPGLGAVLRGRVPQDGTAA